MGKDVQRPSYRGRVGASLWRARLTGSLLALALALPAAGCSMSYQLGSMFGNDEAKPEYTGSIAPKPIAAPPEPELSDADLAYARAAALDVVAKDGKEGKTRSAAWENPKTGARGTVTPIAQAYASDGGTCRDFLASYVREGAEAWLQGVACRGRGPWEVRNMKPWKRT